MFDPINAGLEGTVGLTRFWTDLAAKTMQAALEFAPHSAPPEAIRDVRSAMFQAWAKAWDQFVRSPEFLKMMRTSLAAGAMCGKQVQEALSVWQDVWRGPESRQSVWREEESPAAQTLAAAGQQWREQILTGMETITAQLKRLNRRLDSLEQEVEEERESRQSRTRRRQAGKAAAD